MQLTVTFAADLCCGAHHCCLCDVSLPPPANGQMVLPASFKVVLYCCDGCAYSTEMTAWRHVCVRLRIDKPSSLDFSVYCVAGLTVCALDSLAVVAGFIQQ